MLITVNLGHYNSMDEYNANKSRKRQVNEIYIKNDGNYWEWDSTNNRINYDKMRIKSVTYDKYAQFAIGGLILHRIISFIDVLYLERKVYLNSTFSPESLEFKLSFNLN